MTDIRLAVVICTYQRPDRVSALVHSILTQTRLPEEILVVDSSPIRWKPLRNDNRIRCITSSHANQPYQRYIGYLQTNCEWILYLDDDMEPVDACSIEHVLNYCYCHPEASGFAIHFENRSSQNALSHVPISTLFPKDSMLRKLKGWITGYPSLKPGEWGFCGNRGPQPKAGGVTHWLSGGAFCACREAMYQNFNFRLFDLFEDKLGMGEDAILGYGLAKQGKLIYQPDILFFHNDAQQSHYSIQLKQYACRVMYSRLYLSYEKARLDHSSPGMARLHFIWYGFWRIGGYLVSRCVKRTEASRQMLSGSLQGYKRALRSNFEYSQARNAFWQVEAKKDQ